MKKDRVTLSMGGGGRLSSELIERVFLSEYGNDILNDLDDSAELNLSGPRLAFTTDSYTIKPLFFPGGDIGKLAVCGTVNDLSAKGARPEALSAGFIIEEGFFIEDLQKIASSMRKVSRELNVPIVTGDTKVVNRGDVDGVFINTSGIGTIIEGMNIHASGAKPGDDIIVSGTLADHGIAIMNARESLGFDPVIQSDVASVSGLVEKISVYAKDIHVMRDPTRGGAAGVLNEIAKHSRVNIKIFEDSIPVKTGVRSCCDLLGLDPLYIANEGKIIIFSSPGATTNILKILKSVEAGRDAAVIGKVEGSSFSVSVPPVVLETSIGTRRFIPLLEGDPLPRIC